MTAKSKKREKAQQFTDELLGEKCRCGKPKQRGTTFCKRHHFNLSNEMKKDLHARMGKGYEEAYEMAVKFLRL